MVGDWGMRGCSVLLLSQFAAALQNILPTYPKRIFPTQQVGLLHRVSGCGIQTINRDKYLFREFPP